MFDHNEKEIRWQFSHDLIMAIISFDRVITAPNGWYIVFHGSYSQGKSQNSFFFVVFLEKETHFFRFDRSIKTNLPLLLFVFHVFFCFSCFFHCVHPFWDLSILQKHVWARAPSSIYHHGPHNLQAKSDGTLLQQCLSVSATWWWWDCWFIDWSKTTVWFHVSLNHLRREVKLTTVSSKI